jgi:hypothetical protein
VLATLSHAFDSRHAKGGVDQHRPDRADRKSQDAGRTGSLMV